MYHMIALGTVHCWISVTDRLWLLSRHVYARPLRFAAGVFGVAVVVASASSCTTGIAWWLHWPCQGMVICA